MTEDDKRIERRIDMAVALAEITGTIKLLDQKVDSGFKATNLRLDGLNTFKVKCESQADEHNKDFEAHQDKFVKLKTEFENCNTKHKTEDETKSKITSKTIAVSAIIIALGSWLTKLFWK